MQPKTLVEKIWDEHLIREYDDGSDLLYVDLHLLHEVASPQAFDDLRARGLRVSRPDLTLATADHNVPTTPRSLPLLPGMSRDQIERLAVNCDEFGIVSFGMNSDRQGIVHVIGPELGLSQPGMVLACGDSHTSTHGALGALALSVGSSGLEHVLAYQAIREEKPRMMIVKVDGTLARGSTAKDLILSVIAQVGIGGARGYIVELGGSGITSLSMEGRMTVCNMCTEMGARSAIIAPDATTVEYVRGRPWAPTDANWDEAMGAWSELYSDENAAFERRVQIDASAVAPRVTWGTTPDMSVSVTERVPKPDTTSNPESSRQALEYMGLSGGEALTDIAIDRVFIGSCTNGRIEDLRAAAEVARGRRVSDRVRAMVVPGSTAVKLEAEREGLDVAFEDAGFEWRESGCSMCLGMNEDILRPQERCASTSNRNFEGRQGERGRTHLVSPAMAAAAAIFGRFVDVREIL